MSSGFRAYAIVEFSDYKYFIEYQDNLNLCIRKYIDSNLRFRKGLMIINKKLNIETLNKLNNILSKLDFISYHRIFYFDDSSNLLFDSEIKLKNSKFKLYKLSDCIFVYKESKDKSFSSYIVDSVFNNIEENMIEEIVSSNCYYSHLTLDLNHENLPLADYIKNEINTNSEILDSCIVGYKNKRAITSNSNKLELVIKINSGISVNIKRLFEKVNINIPSNMKDDEYFIKFKDFDIVDYHTPSRKITTNIDDKSLNSMDIF